MNFSFVGVVTKVTFNMAVPLCYLLLNY
jgi:hypothetical protein